MLNIWGTIGLTKYNSHKYWTEEEINFLESIATQIYVAIDHAVLFEEIKQATELKTEFLANMSHEFRTPLNAIIGFSDMMLSGSYGKLSKKQLQYLNNISFSGKHLLNLVNDLLDISKIESGNMTLNCEKFNTAILLKEIIATLKPFADSKNIDIKSIAQDILITADRVRVRQIVYNLLNNAIKFTPENGEVIIKSDINNNKLIIMVEDTGIGIAEKDYDKIFAHFKQIDSSYSRKQEGTGLGLVLTKKLVELHNGSIHFDSEEGKGSRFWFILPKAESINPVQTR